MNIEYWKADDGYYRVSRRDKAFVTWISFESEHSFKVERYICSLDDANESFSETKMMKRISEELWNSVASELKSLF